MESERALVTGLVTQPSGISRHAIRPASSGGLLTRRGQFRARASIRNPPWAGRARTPDRERISTATRARSVTESRLATIHARAPSFYSSRENIYIYIYIYGEKFFVLYLSIPWLREGESVSYTSYRQERKPVLYN